MLDIKGEFNNLWWLAIYSQLGKMGCPKNLYRFLRISFSGRSVTYRTNYSFLVRVYDKGCPQGLNSRPFFWNLVVNAPLELDLGEFVRIITYSDDFALLIEAPKAYICGRRVNIALEKVARWEKLQKITVSAEK